MTTWMCGFPRPPHGIGNLAQESRIPDHEAIENLARSLHTNPPSSPIPLIFWRWIVERLVLSIPTEADQELIQIQLERPDVIAELRRLSEHRDMSTDFETITTVE